jgi:BASS family bile acid:Na+ symporter
VTPDVQVFAETYLVPAQLALAMLGMGATMNVSDFGAVLRDPIGLALGLFLQLVVVPLIALAFTLGFDMSAGWSVGLILVSVVPGGAFSNLLTVLGRGNTPLSISLTVAATAGCVLTVPFVHSLMASSLLPADFSFPTQRIVFEIGLYLMVPLIAGMAFNRFWPTPSQVVSRWAIRGSMALILAVTITSLGSGRIKVLEYGLTPPLLIMLFGYSLSLIIPLICRLAGRYDDDTVALGIEVTVRNIGVALLLVHFFFPGSELQSHVLYTCLFYAGFSGFLAVPLLLLHRFDKSVIPLLPAKRRPEPG